MATLPVRSSPLLSAVLTNSGDPSYNLHGGRVSISWLLSWSKYYLQWVRVSISWMKLFENTHSERGMSVHRLLNDTRICGERCGVVVGEL
jgi:hypothetical protein